MAGKTILWIHGWGTSPRVWGGARIPMATANDGGGVSYWLPDQTHRLFSYSRLNAVDEMRRAVQQALLELKPGDVVVAWSLGAMLVLEAVFSDSYSFSGLIVIAGTLRFVDRDRSFGWPDRIVARMQTQLGTEQESTLQQFAESMLTKDELVQQGGFPAVLDETDFTPSGLMAGLTYLREADLRPGWDRWRTSRRGEAHQKVGKSSSIHLQSCRITDAGYHETAVVRSHLQSCRITDAGCYYDSAVENGNIHPYHTRPKLLWVHGDNDPICPVGAVPADLSAEERCLQRGAGHAPFLTAAAAFEQQVGKFILEA